MKAKLVRKNGKLHISVNGKILPPTACMTYYPNRRTFSSFQEVGTPFASVGAYATDRGINDFSGMLAFGPHFWVNEDTYDFTEVDRTLSLIAPTGTEAYIFPRVYLDSPDWWEKKHPEELCRDERDSSQRQSFASEVWRKDAGKALTALMEHIEQSIWKESVVGYHIACGSTEEWTYHHYTDREYRLDYSEPNRQAFIRWLQKKYVSIDELNQSWKTDYVDFQSVRFPTLLERCYSTNGVLRNPDLEQHTIDFWQYTSWIFADTIDALCRVVKDHSEGNLLTGAFYGYITLLVRSGKGHFALKEVLRSPYVDFVAATCFASALESLDLHNKLFFQEGDVRTCLTRPVGETLPQSAPKNDYFNRPAWNPLPSMDLSVSRVKQTCAQVLTRPAGVWWFDMFGGWFDAPELMGVFEKFNGWMKQNSDGPLKSEIAVIIDEDGLSYMPRTNSPAQASMRQQIEALTTLGAPYDVYEAKDLTEPNFPVNRYKLYLLIDLIHPDATVIEALKTRIAGAGRTLLWGYLSDSKAAGFSVDYHSQLPQLQGIYEGIRFPEIPINGPHFTPGTFEDCYPLATFDGSMEPCVCARQGANHTDIFAVLPALPTQLIREIARMAGVHLYNETDDVIFAGGRYVAITAKSSGYKRIFLPFAVESMIDAETGRKLPLYHHIYADFRMREEEVKVFEILG